MTRSIKDIAYIAGILEGEGHFYCGCSPYIKLSMIDKDIVIKIRNLMVPGKEIYAYQRGQHQIQYALTVNGCLAIQWMMTLYSLMGSRRRVRMREIFVKWKKMKNKQEIRRYDKIH